MLEELLPEGVVAEEILGADSTAYLLPEEQELVATAVDSRRRDVTNARTCARRALSRLGCASAPILRGERGEPLWPDGFVGSLTHTRGYCAAALADAGAVRALGIDAEVHEALPEGVREYVAVADEVAWLCGERDCDYERIHWDRLLFSAKESVYKAWFPLTGRWLGFEDAVVTVDPHNATFTARLLVDGSVPDGPPLSVLTGRFLVAQGFILTAVTV